MAHTIVRRPLDLLKFVSIEQEQFLVSLVNNRDEFRAISHIQALYDAAMAEKSVHENDIVVFQMLTFTHYHFLFATACLMRCHLSEAVLKISDLGCGSAGGMIQAADVDAAKPGSDGPDRQEDETLPVGFDG